MSMPTVSTPNLKESRRRFRLAAVAGALVLVVGVGISLVFWRSNATAPHTVLPRTSTVTSAYEARPSAPPLSPPSPLSSSASPVSSHNSPPPTRHVPLPPANGDFDYQIASPYTVPSGVSIVSRDHSESPASGKYNICYVNGFQAQPEQADFWKSTHNALLLKKGGSYVIDGDWNEMLFDISTAANRNALTTIVGKWIDECATKGYQAVEVDNLDSWTRSKSLLTQEHAIAYAKQLADYTHGKGLAIAQKNTVEIARIGKSQVGFDFAIAESCADYEITQGVPECQGYIDTYGSGVLVIEYDDTHFQRACTRYGNTLPIVRRDRNVSSPGTSSYVFKTC